MRTYVYVYDKAHIYCIYIYTILYIGVFLPFRGGVQGRPDPVPGLRGGRLDSGAGV